MYTDQGRLYEQLLHYRFWAECNDGDSSSHARLWLHQAR